MKKLQEVGGMVGGEVGLKEEEEEGVVVVEEEDLRRETVVPSVL